MRFFLGVTFFLCVAVRIFASSSHLPDLNPSTTIPLFPLDSLRVGQVGQCITVLRGQKREAFSFKILGVTGSPITRYQILVEVSGLGLEKMGIAKGMSGSPCYIDAKFVGALATSFSSLDGQDQALGHITPASLMLSILDPSTLPKVAKPPRFEALAGTSSVVPSIANSTHATSTSVPPLSLFVSGNLMPEIGGLKIPHLQPLSVFPISNTDQNSPVNSSLSDRITEGDALPGDAIGISFIRGDMLMAAIGTLSYRRGNDLLLFAHQISGWGDFKLPLHRAYIYKTVPESSLPYKYGTLFEEIGSTVYDDESGVSARVGEFIDLVPVSIKIHGLAAPKIFNVEIAPGRDYLPELLEVALSSGVLSVLPSQSRATLKFMAKIDFIETETGKAHSITVNRFNPGIDPILANMARQGASYIALTTGQLLRNIWTKVTVKHISVDVTLLPKPRILLLQHASILNPRVTNLERLRVALFFDDVNGGKVRKEVSIQIPRRTPHNHVRIHIGSEWDEFNSFPKSYLVPRDFQEFLEILSLPRSVNRLKIWLHTGDVDVRVKGQYLNSLPTFHVGALSLASLSGTSRRQHQISEGYSLDYAIEGSPLSIAVPIDSRRPIPGIASGITR